MTTFKFLDCNSEQYKRRSKRTKPKNKTGVVFLFFFCSYQLGMYQQIFNLIRKSEQRK
jgi:hypothetical protein